MSKKQNVEKDRPKYIVYYNVLGLSPLSRTTLLITLQTEFSKSPSYGSEDWFYVPVEDRGTDVVRIS